MARADDPGLIPAHVTAVSNRIDLPKHFSDRIDWMRGQGDMEGWLLLVDQGRFRLLSDENVKDDPALAPIRLLIVEGPSEPASHASFANNSADTVLVARLMPVKIGWHRELRRISLPRGFDVFLPPDCNPDAFTILFSTEGYCEIWYTDILRRAAAVPLRKQLHGR